MAASKPKNEQKPTDYVVLREQEPEEEGVVHDQAIWVEAGETSARSAEQAIKNVAQKNPGLAEDPVYSPGRYKAVPARSWKQGLRIETRVVEQASFKEA